MGFDWYRAADIPFDALQFEWSRFEEPEEDMKRKYWRKL